MESNTLARYRSSACFKSHCEVDVFWNESAIKQYLYALIQIALFYGFSHWNEAPFFLLSEWFNRFGVLGLIALCGFGQSLLENTSTFFGVHLAGTKTGLVNNIASQNISLHAH